MTWIIATLIAAIAQTARNATQNGLTRAIGTVGATQVRFLFGLPFAVLFLLLTAWIAGEMPPAITKQALGFSLLGAIAQIGATAMMLLLMQRQSFGLATAWLKTEPVIVALIGAAILGDRLSPLALGAITIATMGVLVMSLKPGTAGQMLRQGTPALLGLCAGGLFGLSAIGFRGGILGLESGGFLIRSGTILVLGLALQTTVLLIWMAAFHPAAIAASLGVWRRSLLAGFLGAFASQFWFIGFALTSAANVRTLALIEVIFASLVARLWFRQPLNGRQVTGMVILLAGVGLLLQAG
jgi:drug/metabolite transporter (DMT)-like permease